MNAAYERVAATPEEKAALSAWIRNTFAPDYAGSALLSMPTRPTRASCAPLSSPLLGYYAKDPAVLAQARDIADKVHRRIQPRLTATFASDRARHRRPQRRRRPLRSSCKRSTKPQPTPRSRSARCACSPSLKTRDSSKRALDYAVSDKVRNQDAAIQLAIALESDETRDLAWKYIQAHWDQVQAQLTTNSGSILIGSTSAFCSNSGREDVEQFFSSHKVAASGQSLKHAIEHIDGCIELRSLQEPQLRAWLASQPRTSSGAAMH